MNKLIIDVLRIKTLTQLAHWQTKNYSKHKVYEELYKKLENHLDRLVEVSISTIGFSIENEECISITDMTDDTIVEILRNFAEKLSKISVNKVFIKNIIEDIEELLWQHIYLLDMN